MVTIRFTFVYFRNSFISVLMSLSTHCIDHITTGQWVVLWVEETSIYSWSKVLGPVNRSIREMAN